MKRILACVICLLSACDTVVQVPPIEPLPELSSPLEQAPESAADGGLERAKSPQGREMPTPEPAPLEEAVVLESASVETGSLDIAASRSFAGPNQYPPSGFAGYGIMAFPFDPARTPARFDMFCRAYLDALISTEALAASGVAPSAQMVTVMPMISQEAALSAEVLDDGAACELATNNYGRLTAQDAIGKANAAAERTDGVTRIEGRGPFLLAWSPGSTFGNNDALVLVADLSNSATPEQAASDLQTWITDIQTQPSLWRRGWNIEGIRLATQRWVDRRGATILRLIGGLR